MQDTKLKCHSSLVCVNSITDRFLFNSLFYWWRQRSFRQSDSNHAKCFPNNIRLIKTQIGHARDFAWFRGQRPSPAHVTARDSVTRVCTDSRTRKPLQLRDKSATLSRAWVVIVRHLDYILITRAGDGRWPRYQVKSLACPGCANNVL